VEDGCGGVVGLEDSRSFRIVWYFETLFIGLLSCRGGCLEEGRDDYHLVSCHWRLSLMQERKCESERHEKGGDSILCDLG
jgi:hypothetical protein